jgi:DNA-binding NarL/FixJ family response regulator
MLIEAQPDLEVVGEAEDGRAALEALAVPRADLVLMDMRIRASTASRPPGDCSPAPRPAAPRRRCSPTFELDQYVFAAIRAGASGFLLKDSRPEELLGVVRTVLRGDAVIAPSATRRLLEHVAAALPPTAAATPAAAAALLTAALASVSVAS